MLALTLCMGTLTIPAAAASSFTDVPSSYWGHPYITEAASKGLVSGIGDGKYGPEDTLSNAQFITMVCNMFYSNQLASQGTAGEWWIPYVSVAASAGLLNGTTAAQQGAANGWSNTIANASISRYDMAQIIYNLAVAQRWEMPDTLSLALTQVLIQDWSSIPTGYQMAVAVCYAKGFMSGDDNSKFNGTASSTRAQAAVVLCSLDDAKTEVTAPTYPNSNRLTNGLSATEENVADLVDDLWLDYPDYGQWDVSTTYTSQRLGVGTGDRGFVYMLSDKIFGGMPANPIDDPADLRIGDVIAFNNRSSYGLVCETDETSFSYVTCDSSGRISWNNDMYRDDLDSGDIVYTRYLTMPEPDDVLSNGEEATEANVEDLMDTLKKNRNYQEGADWDYDEEYESDVLGTARGHQGFAYCLSDEIFDELEATRDTNENHLRLGDVVYDGERRQYGVVVDINWKKDSYTYVSIDDNDEIYWSFPGYLDELDFFYTRYPEDTGYDNNNNQADDELTDGSDVNETNVRSLLNEVLDSNYGSYYRNDIWDMTYDYDDSDVFPDATGSEGFAYFISDEIFGSIPERTVSRAENLRVGDVIRDGSRYGIVYSISTRDYTCTYYTVNLSTGAVETRTRDWDDMDEMYTRYLTNNNSSYLDEDEIEDTLMDVLYDLDDAYNGYWSMNKKYSFDSFDVSSVKGSEAFAYYVSDEVFGDNAKVYYVDDVDDLRVGDVMYDKSVGRYGVVVEISGSTCTYASVNVDEEDDEDYGYINWNYKCNLSRIRTSDMYTRY